jgi:hypothetical protein
MISTGMQGAMRQTKESFVITALLTAFASAGAAAINSGNIDWSMIGFLFTVCLIYSIAHGIVAYFKPTPEQQNDLKQAVERLISAIERLQPPPLQGGGSERDTPLPMR